MKLDIRNDAQDSGSSTIASRVLEIVEVRTKHERARIPSDLVIDFERNAVVKDEPMVGTLIGNGYDLDSRISALKQNNDG